MTFHRPAPRSKQMDYTPKPREVVLRRDPPATMCVPLPKEKPWRSEDYRRLVASYPCAHCGIAGYSNACHGDESKGMGIKSDDRTCWPGCVDRPFVRGCHTLLGSYGLYPQAERRTIEQTHARRTRERIKADGLWKPEWPEFDEEAA